MSMDAELKAKWVAALRSGKYAQGKGKLQKDDKFCCLGVLADVCELGYWTGGLRCVGYKFGEHEGFGFLPPKLRELFGFSDTFQSGLVQMNDDDNLTFPEIADYIEQNI